jgi:hypothetical protein
MGEEASKVENHIEEQRALLDRNLREIESKAAEAVDWRRHYRSHTGAALGVAFTGGLLASRLLTRKSNRGTHEAGYSKASAPSKSMGFLSGLQMAIVSALVQGAREYVGRKFNGQQRQPASQARQASGAGSEDPEGALPF